MNFKNLSLKIALFLGLFLFLIPQVRANPIPAPSIFSLESIVMIFYLNVLFILTLLIEMGVIKTFVKSNKPYERSKDFYKSIFLINLITFPITQVIAFSIFINVLNGLDISTIILISGLIEIFPILLECVLYLKIYNRLNRIPCFVHPVNNSTIIKSTITANLVSFALGFLTYILFLF